MTDAHCNSGPAGIAVAQGTPISSFNYIQSLTTSTVSSASSFPVLSRAFTCLIESYELLNPYTGTCNIELVIDDFLPRQRLLLLDGKK
jgi:hypothetical protein